MPCLIFLAAKEGVRGDASQCFSSLPVELPRLIGAVVSCFSSAISVFAAVFGWRSHRTAAEFAIAGLLFPSHNEACSRAVLL